MRLLQKRLLEFLFYPESDRWLSVLRVGAGLQVILYTWSLRGDWELLFTASGSGLIDRGLTEAILDVRSAWVPRLGWLIAAGHQFGLSEPVVLWIAWSGLLGAGGCLLTGLFCRPAAIVAWFLHLCTAKSSDLFGYGMDNLTTTALFYLMLFQLPDSLSLDHRWRKERRRNPQIYGFQRRVLQLHLCIIYFFGGLTKSLGAGWWNGASIWRALTSPSFNVVSPQTLVSFQLLFPFVGIAVCLLEIGYAFAIWSRKTGAIWLLCVLAMHLSIGLLMGLYLFSLIMIVLNLAAFGDRLFRSLGRDKHAPALA